jgi:hypothetical protein
MLLISIVINNCFQLKREQQQRLWQEKSEQQKWYREKIYESYRKCLEVLIKLQQEYIERINNEITNHTIDQDKVENGKSALSAVLKKPC